MRNLFITTLLLSVFHFFSAHSQNWPADTIRTSINTGDPKFPFPQFQEYKQGKTLGKFNAEGVTHADMEKAMREAYQIMMHRCLYVPGKVLNGKKYIVYNHNSVPYNNNTFVSEGDGYAMLAAAYFADKEAFDGLWLWVHDNRLSKVKKYFDCSNLRPTYRYGGSLPGWKNTETTPDGNGDNDSATDGDYDVAMALLIACIQWGDNMGINDGCNKPISYKEEALKMMKGLVDTLTLNNLNGGFSGFLTGDIGIDGYCKNGNTWGEVTNWRYNPALNTTYPWALNKPEAFGVTGLYTDYIGPAYFNQFAKYLKANGGTKFQIDQFRRGEASSDWLIGQMVAKGYIASSGSCSVNDDGTVSTFGQHPSGPGGEDFRAAWRTILNYMWHGDPDSTWNPKTHQLDPVSNTYEKDMAIRHADFLKLPRTLPGSTPNCQKMGASPDLSCPTYKGVANIKQAHLVTGAEGSDNYRTNYNVGTGAPAAVSSGDLELISEIYRQSEILWDDAVPAMPKSASDYDRYIRSTPKYFHDWFRVLGMLTTTGNLHAPTDMQPSANVKVYMSVDKTYAYAGDLITYTVSFRNYGSLNATGVSIATLLDSDYQFVSATSGGVLNGGTINWTIGNLPGFKTATGIPPTEGKLSFTVKVKNPPAHARVCLTTTITAANSPSWTSNEYPNNASYTMERNCVDLLAARTLSVSKTVDRAVMNPGDIANFKLQFENKSSANSWLNGGRDKVVISYGNHYLASNTFYQFYRFWHSAPEAYINMNNYRVSYFLNDAAAVGLYDATTNPTGWDFSVDNINDLNKYFYNPASGPITFGYQAIPWGSDANGSWNQRIMVRFAKTLTAPTTHIYDKLDNIYLIHKGVIGPGFIRTKMESKPASSLATRLTDDWSYSSTIDIGKVDGQDKRLTPITNSWANFAAQNTPVVNYGKDVCDANVANYSKLLVEEFDGYTWRRIAGNGPLPGRETYNVVVYDTIPKHLAWAGFTDSIALTKRATYTAAPANASYTGVVRLEIPVMLVGDSGALGYRTIAKNPPCPSPDLNFKNIGWIKSETDSPDSSSVNLKVSCNPVPPTPPKETSLKKTANKTAVKAQDPITYTLTFTNTDGATANWVTNTATDWQLLGSGTTMPDMNKTNIDLDQNGNTNKPGANGYGFGHKKAHGKNGFIETTFEGTNSSSFSLVFRHSGGTPGQADFQGVMLKITPIPVGNNTIGFDVYNNGNTPLTSVTNVSFGGSSKPITIKAELIDDKLYVWVGNLTGAPLKVFTGLTKITAGYAGLYTAGAQQKIVSWKTHFDSAFDLILSDPVPVQLNTVTNISNTGTLVNGVITWPNIAGPILAGEVHVRTFDAVVNTCSDFITNTGKATVYGNANIQSQNVVTCGTNPPLCVAPANLTVKDTILEVGKTVTLTALVSPANSAYVYSWYKVPNLTTPFSSGTNKSTITVSDTGRYVVRVADKDTINSACSKIYNSAHVIYSCVPPVAKITTTNLSYCSNLKGVTLEAQAVSGAAYEWKKGPVLVGTSSTLSMADLGTYTLQVKVGACSTISNPVEIMLLEQPLDSIDRTGSPFTYCSGGTGVTLSAIDAGANVGYQWLKDGQAQTGASRVYTNATTGSWSVVVTGANSCKDTSLSVLVSTSQHQTLVISGDTILCPGETLSLSTNLASGITWKLPDGTSQTGNTLTLISPLKGYYRADYSGTGGCTGKDSALVEIENPTVLPTVEISTDKTSYCQTELVKLTATSSNAITPTYEWFINSIKQTSTLSIFETNKLTSNDTVKVIVTSNGTCSGIETTLDTIIPIITPSVKPFLMLKPITTTVCNGEKVTFEIGTVSGQGTVSSYTWFNNGTIAGTGNTLVLTINGSAEVYAQLTSDYACAIPTSANSDTLIVKALSSVEPYVGIISNRTTLCSGDKSVVFVIDSLAGTGDNPIYQWLLAGVPIQGEIKDTLKINSLNDGDKVSLRMTSNSSCRSKDIDVSNEISISIEPTETATISIQAIIGGQKCEGDPVNLIATIIPADGLITWSNGQSGSSVDYKDWVNGESITATVTYARTCVKPSPLISTPILLNGTQRTNPTIDLNVLPDVLSLCPGPNILVAISNMPGLNYSWDINNNTSTDSIVQVVATTSLAGYVKASKVGCFPNGIAIAEKSFSFQVSEPVKVTLADPIINICEGKKASVSVASTGEISRFEWYVQDELVTNTIIGQATLSGLLDGQSIKVVAIPANTCQSNPQDHSVEGIVKTDKKPMNGFVELTPITICQGVDTSLSSLETSDYLFQWLKNGSLLNGENEHKLSNVTAGQYTLIITNGGCIDTSEATIQDGIVIDATADPVNFVPGEAVKASVIPVVGGATYKWSPSALFQQSDVPQATLFPQETGYIKVEVSSDGCTAIDSILLIKVDKLFIPNAITPETGDLNAFWDIKGTEAFSELEVRVYNRWGSLVHEQRGYSKPWDGTLNGKPLPTGTYYYVIKHPKFEKPKAGDLTIVR